MKTSSSDTHDTAGWSHTTGGPPVGERPNPRPHGPRGIQTNSSLKTHGEQPKPGDAGQPRSAGIQVATKSGFSAPCYDKRSRSQSDRMRNRRDKPDKLAADVVPDDWSICPTVSVTN